MRVFIGMETSGALRSRFKAAGHDVCSVDILPAQDGDTDDHVVGDVFEVLDDLRATGWWPDLAIFHPTCTYLTISAEWAYSDGPYHQKVKPETLVGAARRAAREAAIEDVRRIARLPIHRKAIENPIGVLSSRFRRPDQVIQPHWFGDDASKATCLWLWNLPELKPTKRLPGRVVEWPKGSGKMVERWSNQTDSGQNRLPPSADRWKLRSDTFPGVADAFVEQWSNPIGDLFAAA